MSKTGNTSPTNETLSFLAHGLAWTGIGVGGYVICKTFAKSLPFFLRNQSAQVAIAGAFGGLGWAVTERMIGSRTVTELTEKVREAASRQDDVDRLLKQAQSDLADSKKDLESQNGRLAEQVRETMDKNSELAERIKVLESQKARLIEGNQILNQKIRENEKRISNALEESLSLTKQVKKGETELGDLRAELHECKSDLNREKKRAKDNAELADSKLKMSKEKEKALRSSLGDLKERIAPLEAKSAQLEKEITTKEQHIADLRKELAQARQSEAAAKKESTDLLARLAVTEMTCVDEIGPSLTVVHTTLHKLEILQHIITFLPDISDVVRLAAVCKRFRNACLGTNNVAHLGDKNLPSQEVGAKVLFHSAYVGCAWQTELMLRHKANANASDSLGKTPLFYAVQEGHADVVAALIRHEANIDEADLLQAVAKGHRDVVTALLEGGATVTDKALERGVAHYDTFLCLINAAANREEILCRDQLLREAARCGDERVVGLLIEGGADVNGITLGSIKEGGGYSYAKMTPLHAACERGDPKMVERLLKAEARVNVQTKDKKKLTPLHVAAQGGHWDVVSLLLDNGADKLIKAQLGRTALHVASLAGHAHVVRGLLENGDNVDSRDSLNHTPLHLAAEFGRDAVEVLIEYRATINAVNHDDATPLILASEQGRPDVVDKLVVAGANSNAVRKGRSNRTALHWAATHVSGSINDAIKRAEDIEVRDWRGWTALHTAAMKAYPKAVIELLAADAKPNPTDNSKRTPLHLAAGPKRAKEGHSKVVAALIAGDAELEAVDEDGLTPLQLAVASGHRWVTEDKAWSGAKGNKERDYYTAIVTELVEGGAQVNSVGQNGETPLLLSSVLGSAAVRALIEKGAKVKVTNEKGETPLHRAAGWGSLDTVVALIEAGSDVNAVDKEGKTVLYRAAHRKDYKDLGIVAKLVERGAEAHTIDGEKEPSLHSAARFGLATVVDSLLEKDEKADMDEAARSAIGNGHTAVVQSLLKHDFRVDTPDKWGVRPLNRALNIKQPDLGMVRILLNAGANVDGADAATGWTALHTALVGNRGKAIIRELLDQSPNVNSVDKRKRTPLHLVDSETPDEVIVLLIENGAGIDATDEDGRTPLHCLADRYVGNDESSGESAVASLIARGANVNAVDGKGRTPLHIAAAEGNEEIVTLLRNAGAKLNLVDDEGRTPLIQAELSFKKEIVKLLS